MLPSDQDSSTILSPFFLFGHSCHFPGATVFALSDHTFITPAGAKLAIRSQAVGGKCQFLEGLDCWTTVSGAAMNDDKTHFAVIVKERIKGPTAAAAADDDDTSDGDSDEVHHDAAIIVYKLPTMQHGATTEEKNIDMKDLQSAVGSTAIIEASKEVTAPKRVRQVSHKIRIQAQRGYEPASAIHAPIMRHSCANPTHHFTPGRSPSSSHPPPTPPAPSSPPSPSPPTARPCTAKPASPTTLSSPTTGRAASSSAASLSKYSRRPSLLVSRSTSLLVSAQPGPTTCASGPSAPAPRYIHLLHLLLHLLTLFTPPSPFVHTVCVPPCSRMCTVGSQAPQPRQEPRRRRRR